MNIFGYVNSIRLIKNIKPGLDFIEITISHLAYNMFGDYNEFVSLLNKDVYYETRQDMFEGVPIEIVANVTDKQTIKTVEKKKAGIKLLPANTSYREGCNIDLSTLRSGDMIHGCIVYLSSCNVDRSSKARWATLSVLDMLSHVYYIKYFLPFNESMDDDYDIIKGMVGHLIKTDITCRASFGFNTDKVECLMDDIIESDEIAIAEDIINKAVEEDIELQAYLRQTQIIAKLRSMINIEPGYHLVHIAVEIMMSTTLSEMSGEVDVKRLIRAIITSRGYLLSETGNYSKPTINVIKVMQCTQLLKDEELRVILDVMSMKSSPTKRAFIQLSIMSDYLIREKRGLIEDEENNNIITDISSKFGGLL